MRFRRKSREQRDEIRGRATVAFFGAGEVDAVHVDWSGSDAAIHFLVPAYLDKMLINLSAMPDEQQRLLDRMEAFVAQMSSDLDEFSTAFAANIGVRPLATKRPEGQPLAEVDIEVAYVEEPGRLGATSEFRPPSAANERFAELAYWMLWDWSILAGGSQLEPIRFLLGVLKAQCAVYRANGMPGPWDIGHAPYVASVPFVLGLGESGKPEPTPEPSDGLEGRYQLLARDFRAFMQDVAAETAGADGTAYFPRWAMWRACREMVVTYFEIADDEYLAQREAADGEGPGSYDTYLEQFLTDHGLSDVADRLFRECCLANSDDPDDALSQPRPESATASTTSSLSLEQLRDDVNAVLPESNGEPEPGWSIFAIANPTAPVISISRDPRAGPRLTPVFFVGAEETRTLDSVMAGLFEGTDRQALLFHQAGREKRPFLIVPLMYHLTDPSSFSKAMREYLSRLEDVVWFEEGCELGIEHNGQSYRSIRGPDGSLQVSSDAH